MNVRRPRLSADHRRPAAFWARAAIAGAGAAAIVAGAVLGATGHGGGSVAVAGHTPVKAPPMRLAAAPMNQYWMVASDGGIFSFGGAQFFGSTGSIKLNKPIVGMAPTFDGGGYWFVASDGGIFTEGDAGYFGSHGGSPLNKPIVGMAPTFTNGGYWLVASDGGIFSYGDARYFGSAGGTPLAKPIVGMAVTADGGGYWLVASDGGIFAYGDAVWYGSMGGTPLAQPVVGMAATPDGRGYWLVAADGGIFSFGDAHFFGSTGSIHLNKSIVGMASTNTGRGYWFVASDGGIFSFGDAQFSGSTGNIKLAQPVVGMAATPILFPGRIDLSVSRNMIPADGTSTVTVTAHITDGAGTPVPGDLLGFFSDDHGCGSLSPQLAVSDLDGLASATYTASSAIATCHIIVVDVFSNIVHGLITQGAGLPAHITASPGTSHYSADQGNTGIPTTFTVTDGFGHPVSGATVDVTTSEAHGSIPASGVTNASGTVTVNLTDTTAGDSGMVTGTVHGTSLSASTGTLYIDAGNLATLTVSTPATSPTAGTGYDLTVTAADAFNNPVNPSENAITFSGNAVNTFNGNTPTEVWQGPFTNGQATVTVTSFQAEPNNGATLTVSDPAIQGSTSPYTINPAGAAAIAASPAGPGTTSISANTMNASGLQVSFAVKDAFGNPVPNVPLTLAHTGSFSHATGVPSSPITTADGTGNTTLGVAAFTFKDTNVADGGTFKAALASPSTVSQATGPIAITPGPFANMFFSDSSTATAGQTTSTVAQKTAGTTVPLFVFATDAFGNATAPTTTTTIAGTALAAAPDGATGTVSPSSIPVSSFTNGVASVSFTPTDAQQGATLAASSGSVTGNATFDVVAGTYTKLLPVSTSFITSDLNNTSLFFQSPPTAGTPVSVTLKATDSHLNPTITGISSHSVKVTLAPDGLSVMEPADSGSIKVGTNPAGVSDAAGAPVSQVDTIQPDGTVAVTYTTPASPVSAPIAGVGQITCADTTPTSPPTCVQPVWVTVTTLTSVVMTPPGTTFTADTSSQTGVSLTVVAKQGSTAEGNVPIDYSATGFTGNPQPPSPELTASSTPIQAVSLFKPSLVTAAGTVTANLRGAPLISTALRSTPPSIAITPGNLFSLTVGNLSPSIPTAGTQYTATVTAADKEGNNFDPGVAATASGPLTTDSIGGHTDTVTVGAFSSTGVAQITGKAYKAETATFTITDVPASGSVSSAPFSVTVQPAAPATTALSLSVAIGCCTADQGHTGVGITVNVSDTYGNPIPNVSVTLSTTLQDATVDPGTGTYQAFPATLTTASTGTIGQATATFKDYLLPNNGKTPDAGNITATVAPGTGSLTQNAAVTIVAGTFHSITIDPVANQVAGTSYTAFASAFDTYGNLEESYTPSSTFTQSGTALAASPAPASKTATATWGALTAAFKAPLTITSYNAQQAAQLTVSDGGISSTPATYNVAPATAFQLALASVNGTAYTSSADATETNSNNATFTFVLKVEDQYNNPVTATNQTDTVNLTLAAGTIPDGGWLQANTTTNPDTTTPAHTTCTLAAGSCSFIYQAPSTVAPSSTGDITWTDSPLVSGPSKIIMSA